MEEQPRIVVTGTDWMGQGVASIDTTLDELFHKAEHEISITAYSITSGGDLLFERIETALARGVYIRMIINRFEEQEAGALFRLRGYLHTYPHMNIFNYESDGDADLHAKVIVVDRKIALVGSSNISRRGLLKNHELAVLIEGEAASQSAQVIDRLLISRFVMPVG